MGRIGPVYLMPVKHNEVDTTVVKDIGGMLHKAVQLVGDLGGVSVEVAGTLDPLVGKTDVRGEPRWILIGTLTEADPYKHHTGWIRWLRLRVLTVPNDAMFGVVGMGED